MGILRDIVENLERSENLTRDLLKLWSSQCESTAEKLIVFLREDGMDRDYVATILEDWLETKISNE